MVVGSVEGTIVLKATSQNLVLLSHCMQDDECWVVNIWNLQINTTWKPCRCFRRLWTRQYEARQCQKCSECCMAALGADFWSKHCENYKNKSVFDVEKRKNQIQILEKWIEMNEQYGKNYRTNIRKHQSHSKERLRLSWEPNWRGFR